MTHVKKKFLEDFFSRPGGRYNETPKVIEAGFKFAVIMIGLALFLILINMVWGQWSILLQ